MSRERLILFVGIGFAVLAAVFLGSWVKQFEQKKTQEIQRQVAKQTQARQVGVLVARKDIAKGATITQDAVESKKVAGDYLQPGAANSFDRIAGMVVIAPIYQGEQITLSKLSQARKPGGLADVTPLGKRAVTISVDNLGSLVGMVKPGDYVDIMALLTIPLMTSDRKSVSQLAVVPVFQNVLVLAVGRDVALEGAGDVSSRYGGGTPQQQASAPQPFITISLTPQEANLMAFVQENGKLRLALRSPADSKMEQVQPANWDTFFGYVMPFLKEQKGPQAAKPDSYIEVYRGLNKESVPVFNKKQ